MDFDVKEAFSIILFSSANGCARLLGVGIIVAVGVLALSFI